MEIKGIEPVAEDKRIIQALLQLMHKGTYPGLTLEQISPVINKAQEYLNAEKSDSNSKQSDKILD